MRKALLAALALAAAPTLAAAETVSGTVTYLQRMMLPPDSVVEIAFQDTSLADAPATTLATYRIEAPGAPPYAFAFDYDPAQIDEARSYTLRATVRQGDTLLMTTDTVYPVLTRGAGNEVEMVMKAVGQGSGTGETPDSDFVNTYWKLLTLGRRRDARRRRQARAARDPAQRRALQRHRRLQHDQRRLRADRQQRQLPARGNDNDGLPPAAGRP